MSADGFTKRERMAAKAMQGLCASSIPGSHHGFKQLASEAVSYADALLEELSVGQRNRHDVSLVLGELARCKRELHEWRKTSIWLGVGLLVSAALFLVEHWP